MEKGYIKLHRKILEWQWYDDPDTFRLFIYLLLTTNYEDKMWRNIEVKRGQLITSLEHMANGTGLSVQNIRTCLSRLEKSNEIEKKSTKKYTLVTIVKYSDYQDNEIKINTRNNKQSTNN